MGLVHTWWSSTSVLGLLEVDLGQEDRRASRKREAGSPLLGSLLTLPADSVPRGEVRQLSPPFQATGPTGGGGSPISSGNKI